MLFSSLHLGIVSILVPTFLIYQFQFLIQLTLVILVLSVSQQTEMADVANGLIKILIRIHRVSWSPMPPGFQPLYSHVTLTNPQINTRNPKSPKSVPETLDSQNSSFDRLSQNHDQNPRLPTQLILISQNHDQNKQSSKPNGSKLFNRFQREEESANDVLL